eukprot:2672056-Amphidinium_carterae.1
MSTKFKQFIDVDGLGLLCWCLNARSTSRHECPKTWMAWTDANGCKNPSDIPCRTCTGPIGTAFIVALTNRGTSLLRVLFAATQLGAPWGAKQTDKRQETTQALEVVLLNCAGMVWMALAVTDS